jgi:hypothetical protein
MKTEELFQRGVSMKIGEELGYDIRGIQGLLAWGGKYLTMIAGNKVALKEKGIERLKVLGLIP